MSYYPKFITAWIAILFGISISLSAQTLSDPIEFHNFLAEEQNKITLLHMDYVSYSVHSDDYLATEKLRLEVIQQLESSRKKIEGITASKGDEKLKTVSLEVLNLYYETFTIELNEANLLKKDSRSSFEAMEKYFKAQDKAEAKLDHATTKFEIAQENFARKHKLKMAETDARASRKLRRIGEVNDYTRMLFLMYFKVSKSNASFRDALKDQKAHLMEKYRRELLGNASEVIAQLKSQKDFYGDKKTLESTKTLIRFYQQLAGKDYAELTRIVKNQDKLTQEDVDNYNEMLERIPKDEQKLLDKFSANRQGLLKKHIPNSTSSSGVSRI